MKACFVQTEVVISALLQAVWLPTLLSKEEMTTSIPSLFLFTVSFPQLQRTKVRRFLWCFIYISYFFLAEWEQLWLNCWRTGHFKADYLMRGLTWLCFSDRLTSSLLLAARLRPVFVFCLPTVLGSPTCNLAWTSWGKSCSSSLR